MNEGIDQVEFRNIWFALGVFTLSWPDWVLESRVLDEICFNVMYTRIRRDVHLPTYLPKNPLEYDLTYKFTKYYIGIVPIHHDCL